MFNNYVVRGHGLNSTERNTVEKQLFFVTHIYRAFSFYQITQSESESEVNLLFDLSYTL
jgi:hypothetical protein